MAEDGERPPLNMGGGKKTQLDDCDGAYYRSRGATLRTYHTCSDLRIKGNIAFLLASASICPTLGLARREEMEMAARIDQIRFGPSLVSQVPQVFRIHQFPVG